MTHPRKPAQQFRVPLKQVLHMSDVTSLPVGWFNSTVLQGNQDHHDKALKEKDKHITLCAAITFYHLFKLKKLINIYQSLSILRAILSSYIK